MEVALGNLEKVTGGWGGEIKKEEASLGLGSCSVVEHLCIKHKALCSNTEKRKENKNKKKNKG